MVTAGVPWMVALTLGVPWMVTGWAAAAPPPEMVPFRMASEISGKMATPLMTSVSMVAFALTAAWVMPTRPVASPVRPNVVARSPPVAGM